MIKIKKASAVGKSQVLYDLRNLQAYHGAPIKLKKLTQAVRATLAPRRLGK